MERSEILTTMRALKLYGMKSAYDEIIATAIKRQHVASAIWRWSGDRSFLSRIV